MEIKESEQRGLFNYIVTEVIGNIALFVPIGFLLPLLWKRFEKILAVLLCYLTISFAMSLFSLPYHLELLMLMIWMNTLGGIIGYLAYALIRRLAKTKTDKLKPAEKMPAAIG